MDLVILGAGSHGTDLFHIAQAAGHTVGGFLDDNLEQYDNCRQLSNRPTNVGYLIGINSPSKRYDLDMRHHPAAIAIHPSANIGPEFHADPGVVVAPGVTIGNGVRLGRHVHVNQASSLVRCTVGDYTTIAPGVHVAGDVTIGAGVFIGIGARISNLVTIGDGATIGAGAVVIDDVPELATFVGVPARPLTVGTGA